MAGPLLETKFHLPRSRTGVIARPRLLEKLDSAAHSTLTLVSAPAGFGKTTLLSQWLRPAFDAGRPTAWLSLDHRDNDPTVFWAYVITALQAVAPGVGAPALSLLQTPAPSIEAVLSSLLNDLGAGATEVLLVLDDYHVIDTRDIHEAVAFLVDHCPAQLRLVIGGRADPALPLARLRSRGELLEIRATDLRFTPAEAAGYLNDMMGLALTAADVAALDARTEGWIAALQLAALSMQGRNDIAAFIKGFAGDDRYIVDYLAEEVLNQQPDEVRQFLLRTSVLDRFTGPLCDAVTGQVGGKAMVAALERRNLFLVPLDDHRRWYRYHQLFADVLQAHLVDEQPAALPELHRRASQWYEQTGDIFESIRHALIANDVGKAADLIEKAIPTFSRNRQEAAVRGWIQALPPDLVRARPVLTVGFAGALLSGGQLEGVEGRLQDAEKWLRLSASGPGTAGMVVVDQEQFRRLPAMIALYRAASGLAAGDLDVTVRHARQAVDLSAGDDLGQAAAAGLLGLASWTGGELEAAHTAYSDCSAGLLRAGHVADTLGCAIALADIRLIQGRLGDAQRTLEQARQRAAEEDGPVLRGTADMNVGLSEIYRERGDLPAAAAHLHQGQELGEELGLPQNRYRQRVALARLREAEGDLEAAVALLDEAERYYVGDFFPNVHPVPARRARVWIRQGRLDKALGWGRERGLSAADDLSYLREFEHITLARMLMAGDSLDVAIALLERLRQAAEAGRRSGSVLEISVLQALSYQAHGDRAAASTALERAVGLARPEGYVRIFLDEGQPMADLLAVPPAGTRDFVKSLLRAGQPADGHPGVQQGLIDPLSEREWEVLQLLATDLDGPAIARRLFVSLNTVRTHTRNIYSKLGANNRRTAVRRAADLGLLSRTPHRSPTLSSP